VEGEEGKAQIIGDVLIHWCYFLVAAYHEQNGKQTHIPSSTRLTRRNDAVGLLLAWMSGRDEKGLLLECGLRFIPTNGNA